jgi:hypothetical protein
MRYIMASQRSARHIDSTTMFLSELDSWVAVIPPQAELCTQQIIQHIVRPINHFVIHPSQPYGERRNPYMLQESFFQQPTDPMPILFPHLIIPQTQYSYNPLSSLLHNYHTPNPTIPKRHRHAE